MFGPKFQFISQMVISLQEGIQAANCTTQQNIQIVVHRIFELLVEALHKTLPHDESKDQSELYGLSVFRNEVSMEFCLKIIFH